MYDSLRVDHSSTVDRAVDELRRALFDGELAPGTPLREVALAEQIRVSRSTVREALTALVAEGLATRVPHRGVTVATLRPADVRDVSRARTVLETAGVCRWPEAEDDARDAVRHALDRYTETLHRGEDRAAATAAHLAVHRALVGLTGSERLLTTADALHAELRLALARVDAVRRDAPQQIRSHERLIALLESGDQATARTELEHHLAGAEESLLEVVSAGRPAAT